MLTSLVNFFRVKSVDRILGTFVTTRDKLDFAAQHHDAQATKFGDKATQFESKAGAAYKESIRAQQFRNRINEFLS